MDKFLLFILDRVAGIYRFFNIDYLQLRTIVAAKLLMDGRRQTLMMGQQQSGKSRGYFFAVFIYFIFGLLVSLLIYLVPSVMVALIFIFSYIIVMVVMILITDFSSVLLDTSDNSIILPRPVSSTTLLAARITHIVMYVGLLVFALSLGSIVAVAIQYSFATLFTFLLSLLLSVLFAVTLTNGLYLFIMRFTSEERLKNIINYLQIGMTILFMGSYQLLPRLLGNMDDLQMAFSFQWWSYLVPSIWFSAAVDAVQNSVFDVHHAVMIALTVIIPAGSVYIVSKYFAPAFVNKLQDLGQDTRMSAATKKEERKNSWFERSINYFVGKGAERSGFLLTQKTLARDRKLKLKIYPAMGYLVVIVFVVSIQFFDKGENWMERISESSIHLLLIYFSTLVLHTAIFELSYSDNFKSSWVFFSSPVQNPGAVLSGSLKGVIVSLFIPFYLIISAIVLFFWREKAIDDLLFGLVNNLVIIFSLAILSKKHLPLSLPDGARNNASNFARGIMMMLVLGFLGFLHYGVSRLSGAVWIMIPIFAIALYFMHKSYSAITWEELRKGE